jgi:hypothetical protein
MAMEHHRCFHVYIVKTNATRISDSVFFKHQYITNPQLTPETLVLKATLELTSALKGMVSHKAETADAMARVSELFHNKAEAKAAMAKAKEQWNTHRTYHFQGRSLIRPLNQPYPFQRCRLLPQWMIVAWWVVVVKDRLYILQRRLFDPDCRLF